MVHTIKTNRILQCVQLATRPRRFRCRHAFFELIAIVAHANKNYDKNNDGNPVRVTATATSIDGRGHDTVAQVITQQ